MIFHEIYGRYYAAVAEILRRISEGTLAEHDIPEITAEKAEWVKSHGFGGIFYWAYSMDVFEQDVKNPDDSSVKILQKTVYESLNG